VAVYVNVYVDFFIKKAGLFDRNQIYLYLCNTKTNDFQKYTTTKDSKTAETFNNRELVPT